MPTEPACKFCGCTNSEPCRARSGLTCCWATPDVCSFCELSPARRKLRGPRVEIFSEFEAAAVIDAVAANEAEVWL